MKTFDRLLMFGLGLAWMTNSALADPLGNAFTYRGQLKQSGSPANGNYNMVFTLWNDPTASAPANQVGGPVTLNPVPVTGGLFTVKLNSAAEYGVTAFDGNRRWLEITVNGTRLTPRQEVTAAPYAQFAQFAARPWLTSASDTYFTGGNVGVGTSTIFADRRLEANASSINAIAMYAENNTPALGLPTLYVTNLGAAQAGHFQNGDVVVVNGRLGVGT